jgi:hypothetical protein
LGQPRLLEFCSFSCCSSRCCSTCWLIVCVVRFPQKRVLWSNRSHMLAGCQRFLVFCCKQSPRGLGIDFRRKLSSSVREALRSDKGAAKGALGDKIQETFDQRVSSRVEAVLTRKDDDFGGFVPHSQVFTSVSGRVSGPCTLAGSGRPLSQTTLWFWAGFVPAQGDGRSITHLGWMYGRI